MMLSGCNYRPSTHIIIHKPINNICCLLTLALFTDYIHYTLQLSLKRQHFNTDKINFI